MSQCYSENNFELKDCLKGPWRLSGIPGHIFLKIHINEVELVYNFGLISAIQPSDSVAHIQTFLSMFLCIVLCHRILNIVPCAIQWDFVVYRSVFNSLHLLIPSSQSVPPCPSLPLASTSLFSLCICFCFIGKFICGMFQFPRISDVV